MFNAHDAIPNIVNNTKHFHCNTPDMPHIEDLPATALERLVGRLESVNDAMNLASTCRSLHRVVQPCCQRTLVCKACKHAVAAPLDVDKSITNFRLHGHGSIVLNSTTLADDAPLMRNSRDVPLLTHPRLPGGDEHPHMLASYHTVRCVCGCVLGVLVRDMQVVLHVPFCESPDWTKYGSDASGITWDDDWASHDEEANPQD